MLFREKKYISKAVLSQKMQKHSFCTPQPCDQFDLSRKIILSLFGITLLCLTLVLLDLYLRTPGNHEEQIIQAISLSNLSIVSSGRPLRHPEGLIPSVNLKFSPPLGSIMINAEYLLLNPPRHSKSYSIP
jgi:hypothetical protein